MLSRVRAVWAAALESGALKPIETEVEVVPSVAGLQFALRVVKSFKHKDIATKERTQRDPTRSTADNGRKKRFNPFLPYEDAMFVQHVGMHHVLLLNKFPVVDAHVLLVTKQYEEQNALLTANDFAALWDVLQQLDGLAFYNAGTIAGASQHHKHLQVVAGALSPDLPPGRAPFDHVFTHANAALSTHPFSSPLLPFSHLAVGVDDAFGGDRARAADICMARYTQILHELGKVVDGLHECAEEVQPFPYNLLVNRRWMMVVPRREECFHGVSVNSLGFGGCLLVRDAPQLEDVKVCGPMAVLEYTGFKRTVQVPSMPT